jgi:putative cell wall-binding protein
VGGGQTVEIDPLLHVGAKLTGSLAYRNLSGEQSQTTANVQVLKPQSDGALVSASNVDGDTDASLDWWAYGVFNPGTYAVRFEPDSIHGDYDFPPQYYGGRSAADAVRIQAGLGVTTVNTVLQPASFTANRVSGATRYETAAAVADAVAAGEHPPIAYLASGATFPDALSAGPSAAEGHGVVLTTDPTTLPAATADELQRLQPGSVVIVGGANAISDTVAASVAKITGSTPTRVQGADRYETSRILALQAFPHGATTAFIATGANYPDALSAGAAAAKLGGPVILVDGSAPALDPQTSRLLTTLGVKTVDIAGGESAVSDGIQADLQKLNGGTAVYRYGGTDRWETSSEISEIFVGAEDTAVTSGTPFTDPTNTVLASGTTFADAVVAAPLAAELGAPIELAQPTCIPEVSMSLIIREGGTSLTVVGGPSALSDNVTSAHACSGPYQSGHLDLSMIP